MAIALIHTTLINLITTILGNHNGLAMPLPMELTKGQKIQKAMEEILKKGENPEPKGCGLMATCLPRKKEQPLANTNNPPVA